MPFYTALHRDEFLFADASLDTVLAFVADCNAPQFGEDAVVWCGGRVVAVCRPDGSLVRFDGPPGPPAAPADLAVVDDGAVEDAA
jgi:hypothetical protein